MLSMPIYILIMILHTHNGGYSVTTQEFTTLERCEAVVKIFEPVARDNFIGCFKK